MRLDFMVYAFTLRFVFQTTAAKSFLRIRLGYRSDQHLVGMPGGVTSCSKRKVPIPLQVGRPILTFETPDAEEIARAIWQRQHALGSQALSHNAKWRDQSIPPKFWDGFLQDAHAFLKPLYKKHIEYNKAGAHSGDRDRRREIDR
jgi:hypothetical protein